MLKLEGIDHVGFEVADPERTADWYTTVLGLERRFQDAWGDLPVVVGGGASALALFPRGPEADAVSSPGRAADHVAFRVDRENLARARAILERHGVAIRSADYGISRSLHFHDPDGHHMEITTYDLEDPG